MSEELINLLHKIELLEKENNKLNRALKNKKFGLSWIDIPEGFEKESYSKLPLLEEIQEHEINIENTQEPHILIEGDNFHSLTCLNYTHKENIDIIYIDPPYNTGSDDFIYRDKRILDKYPDGKKVDKDDPARHSKWLSFMNKRLVLAKNLLKQDGVIFISIGDDELANLKLLCNQIFGENNFLGQISRIQKKGSDLGDFFKPTVDYILAYSRNKIKLSKFKIDIDQSKFNEIEIDGIRKGERYESSKALYQSSLKDLRPNQKYAIECPDGTLVMPPYKVFDEIHREGEGRWRWSKETYMEKKDEILVFKKTKNSPLFDQNGNKSEWNIYTKRYLNDAIEKGNVPSNIFENFLNAEATKELQELEINFSFPKPTSLIKQLIKITQKPNNIKILDFFAGSGTTGHAVLSLNEEDEGTRQFILCTNNENNICLDITLERLKRVIQPKLFLPGIINKIKLNKIIEKKIDELYGKIENTDTDKLLEEKRKLEYQKTTFIKTKKGRIESKTDEDYIKLLSEIKFLDSCIKENMIKESSKIENNKKIRNEISKLESKLFIIPKDLKGSLKYYRTKFSGNLVEYITDDERIELAKNAGELISISENALIQILKNDYSQFFTNKSYSKLVSIYFNENLDNIEIFKHDLIKYSNNIDDVIIYMFRWANENYSSLFEDLNLRIKIQPIPQPILEIYKKLYRAQLNE